MIDVAAALEVLVDVASQENPVQVVTDARAVYGFYTQPATITADVKAGKIADVTGPIARTLALADKLAADPATAPHLAALILSLAPSTEK